MLKPFAVLLLAAAVSATPLAGAVHLIEKMQAAALQNAENQARSEIAISAINSRITGMQ